MRARLGVLFPFALVSAGCSLRPWTPSVSVAFWSEDVPDAKEYTLPTSNELAQRWQNQPSSPWSRYHKATLISSVDPMGGHASLPDIQALDVLGEADAAAANLAKAGLPAGTMWLLDLRGAASCVFASRLSRDAADPVAPVVTFNNWPANTGLVPAEETLAGLVLYPPKLPPSDPAAIDRATPVFLLDSWRLAYRFDEPDDDVYDNRYMLQASDLPDAQTLKDRGITKVVYVVEDLDDAEVEEDDLYESFRAWSQAGIAIFFVDLDFLAKTDLSKPVDWALRFSPRSYYPKERWTLVDDPVFYGRARGGFGLAYGRPFITPGYRGWGWHYGSGSGGGGGWFRGSSGSGG
ncbi:MAG: hypothetical protein KIT84_34835 [Labilithrix sp.]|nr:hypothetical protein [Labilithrix sp.]MCW5816226.1 hypothetical protein [Labilithrix sp.]